MCLIAKPEPSNGGRVSMFDGRVVAGMEVSRLTAPVSLIGRFAIDTTTTGDPQVS